MIEQGRAQAAGRWSSAGVGVALAPLVGGGGFR